MYSRHSEGKSVVADRSIRTLKSRIYKHMTMISKNICNDKLYEIVDKYDKTCHRTIKMKSADVKVFRIIKKILN